MKTKWFAVWLLLCLLLTACGNTDSPPEAPDSAQADHSSQPQAAPVREAAPPAEETAIGSLSQLIPALSSGGEICILHPYEVRETYLPAAPEQQAVFSELLLQADIGSFTAVTQEDLRNILGGTVALAVRDSGEDTTLWIMNTPEFHYIIICYPDGEQVFLKGPADVLPYQGLKEAETDSLKAASQAGTIRPPGVPSSSQAP